MDTTKAAAKIGIKNERLANCRALFLYDWSEIYYSSA